MQGQERERKEPSEFNVIVKAKDLVKHTFTIANSTERYPKKYRFTLVNRIQEKMDQHYNKLFGQYAAAGNRGGVAVSEEKEEGKEWRNN